MGVRNKNKDHDRIDRGNSWYGGTAELLSLTELKSHSF